MVKKKSNFEFIGRVAFIVIYFVSYFNVFKLKIEFSDNK